MGNPSYTAPFNVKLSGKATAFHDLHTRLTLHSKQVGTVTEVTDHIRQWLMSGGLETTEEKATVGVGAKAATLKPPTKPVDEGKGGAAATDASKGKSATRGKGGKAAIPPKEPEIAEEDVESEGSESEPSVDDILNENK